MSWRPNERVGEQTHGCISFTKDLHGHMMAVACPCMRERGLNDGTAMPAPAQVGMGDDVLQEVVSSSTAQEVRRSDAANSARSESKSGG
jgi:hypothetical protein